MDTRIGILTQNNELQDDLKQNYPKDKLVFYKSVESIKKEDYSIFLIDSEYFESIDLIQFFLSKVRKKILEMPVLLILRVNILEKIKDEWFFDDFILYPFRKGELTSRINRLIHEKNPDENTIHIWDLRIDLKEYSVSQNNIKMDLTYKEFELLRLFVQNRGKVFSRKELLNKIWGIEYIGGTRTVDVHIRRLRSKLGEEFSSSIETVRNVGYRCSGSV